ncbi:MAG: CDP-alcohol phosphatidyltransferase family protein [Alphaproteobacteria bacterium]|nr:CDP-alcohol phosphatidyltransferase family protein [Alphaproteobacteria bacterium]
MLDSTMRRFIDPPLNAAAAAISKKISANSITIGGFFIGLISVYAVAQGRFELALACLLLNRLADGLDGAVARQSAPTDLGAYLDIVSDFLLWSLLPLAFLFYDMKNAFAAALLLSSFAMSMTVFLAFAIQAEKRGTVSEAQGKKGFYYLAGLAEGTETIAFFALVMLYPAAFAPAALAFAAFVYLSVIGRIIVSMQELKER